MVLQDHRSPNRRSIYNTEFRSGAGQSSPSPAQGADQGSHTATYSGSPLPSPQKQLLAELVDASKYLQQLNARLDVDGVCEPYG